MTSSFQLFLIGQNNYSNLVVYVYFITINSQFSHNAKYLFIITETVLKIIY